MTSTRLLACAVITLLVLSLGCSSDDDSDGAGSAAADLGVGCLGAMGSAPCGDDLECIDMDAVGGPVCTKTCDTSAECPGNGHCYIFDGDDGHICARLCQNDDECAALVPGLRCRELSSTGGRKICAS